MNFHPLVNSWFAETFGKPTAVQEAAWPLIAEGKNVLAIAPTGSGKTLTAFLAALSKFIDGSWDSAELSALYVSPLKALNEDIKRNLIEPVEQLRAKAVREAAIQFPGIRIETRSGDTPQAERRRFLLQPPSILAVTPESLAILLLNPHGRDVLSSVKYLVLDEIHAAMGTKRGAFLACQIDRLRQIAGSFQRVALSATVNPPELAAEFAGADCIAAPPAEKKIEFLVDFPALPGEAADNLSASSLSASSPPESGKPAGDRYGKRYTILVNFILERIRRNKKSGRRSILVFTDSRRRAERLSYLVNTAAGEHLALCHHGSLSKEVRRDVEQSLARGNIPCVIATSSLELGLDIGEVDEVILAGTPASSAQTLQRIGRAGHGVGEVSRGVLVPFHGSDLLLGAVMAGAVADREIERIHAPENPLDILAQIILALVCEKAQSPGELYDLIKTFYVFRNLRRESFDSVIAMLTGKYFDETLRDLKPRIARDIDGKLYPSKGILALLYSSGGVIPNRGLYSMRLSDGTKIGELDEEFVWERRLGDSFDFGARSWKVIDIGSEAITVIPQAEGADFTPFWKADTPFRAPELCLRMLDFFDARNRTKNNGITHNDTSSLSKDAAEALEALLSRQEEVQGGVKLPDRNSIVVELIDDPAVRPDSIQAVFHSFRGGAVNYPLAMAMAGLLEEKTGQRIETIPDDNAVMLLVPRTAANGGDGLESLIRNLFCDPVKAEAMFKRRLESSGIFGAAFREAAERSMLLPRGSFGRRIPLWVTRQRAKRLFDKAAAYEGFPIVTEAWRTCLSDNFDMKGFTSLLDGLARGSVALNFFSVRAPSPFARDLVWKEVNNFIYEYDERKDLVGLRAADPIAAALADPTLRPRIKAPAAASFAARLRRELPGWAPEDALSLAQWVRERVAVPADEWETLFAVLPEELQKALREDPSLAGRIRRITLPGAALAIMVHTETAAEPEEFLSRLGEWLRFEGPLSPLRVAAVFGCTSAGAEDALDALSEAGETVSGIVIDRQEQESQEQEQEQGGLYCDTENFDLLLRLARRDARPRLEEKPAAYLVPFIALRQGLVHSRNNSSGNAALERALETLALYPAPVKLWETELFPARISAYSQKILDTVLEGENHIWFGAGPEKAVFCSPGELDLAPAGNKVPDSKAEKADTDKVQAAFTEFCGSHKNFWEINDELVRRDIIPADSFPLCQKLLWEEVWQGRLSSSSWESIRKESYAETGNAQADTVRSGTVPRYPPAWGSRDRGRRERRIPRALREHWKQGAPVPGNWYSLAEEFTETNELAALEEEDRNRDRIRLLLRRWGILARPFLESEGCFSWSALLPAMRRMELAGELTAGRFFAGIHSLQFVSPAIVRELEEVDRLLNEPPGGKMPIYWMNAADPASPAGWNIDGLDSRIPPRTQSSRLCFRGKELAAVSGRGGRELEIFIDPGDPDLGRILAFLALPRTRAVQHVTKIVLETINGVSAAESPYGPALTEMGFIPDRNKLFLW